MASGKSHTLSNLSALGLLGGAFAYAHAQGYTALYGLGHETLLAFVAAYLVGTFLITPDLDLADGHVLAKTNWGLLGLLWVPYGLLFKHRGLSHSWFLGPLTRLVYIAAVALMLASAGSLLARALGYGLRLELVPGEGWHTPAVAGLAGYYLSQWLHLMMDGVRPGHGLRRLRRRPRRRAW